MILKKMDIPATVWDVPTPAFLVDIDIVQKNCREMLDRCQKMGLILRPHMKTHKTIEAAELMTGGSKRCIVVSTIAEAHFYADHGFEDVLYGIPIKEAAIKQCLALSHKLEEFHIMLDSHHGLECLKNHPLPDGKRWSVFLNIDAGYHRCGLLWDDPETLEFGQVVQDTPCVKLKGIYTHCGLSYRCKSASEIEDVSNKFAERMLEVASKFKLRGVELSICGIGSTPSASQPGDKVALLDEIHPGNYVFRDMQQVLCGASTVEQVACRVATRVIGHYPHNDRMIVDCGFTGLTEQGKDSMPSGCCLIQGEPNLMLTSMSQEHGEIHSITGKMDYKKYPINSMLFFYPYHSCATANCYQSYYIHSGGKIVGIWKPVKGWY